MFILCVNIALVNIRIVINITNVNVVYVFIIIVYACFLFVYGCHYLYTCNNQYNKIFIHINHTQKITKMNTRHVQRQDNLIMFLILFLCVSYFKARTILLPTIGLMSILIKLCKTVFIN